MVWLMKILLVPLLMVHPECVKISNIEMIAENLDTFEKIIALLKPIYEVQEKLGGMWSKSINQHCSWNYSNSTSRFPFHVVSEVKNGRSFRIRLRCFGLQWRLMLSRKNRPRTANSWKFTVKAKEVDDIPKPDKWELPDAEEDIQIRLASALFYSLRGKFPFHPDCVFIKTSTMYPYTANLFWQRELNDKQEKNLEFNCRRDLKNLLDYHLYH